MISIRREGADDSAAIHRVNAAAFLTEAEANLVDALREAADAYVSLIAEQGGSVVGHICFTPVAIESGPATLRVAGLAPMAVLPEMQRRAIGSALVRRGLEEILKAGFDAVVVLRHPRYYPRFGFIPASRFGLRCEYDVPDEVFMALELRNGSLEQAAGMVRYHPAFAAF